MDDNIEVIDDVTPMNEPVPAYIAGFSEEIEPRLKNWYSKTCAV